MNTIGPVLIEFLLRLCLGVALAMCLTSPRLVASGFFRVHLWVLLGLATFASLFAYSAGEALPRRELVGGLSVACAVLSYVGAAAWLYERQRAGRVVLGCICAASAIAAVAMRAEGARGALGVLAAAADTATAAVLLGGVLSAMFLGHWYLNAPGMQLAPLRRLIALAALGAAARAVVCGLGLAAAVAAGAADGPSWWIFLALRWTSGLALTAVVLALTWQTLKIPNTQSATGILYAGVILAFIGELTAQLLSANGPFPL